MVSEKNIFYVFRMNWRLYEKIILPLVCFEKCYAFGIVLKMNRTTVYNCIDG